MVTGRRIRWQVDALFSRLLHVIYCGQYVLQSKMVRGELDTGGTDRNGAHGVRSVPKLGFDYMLAPSVARSTFYAGGRQGRVLIR